MSVSAIPIKSDSRATLASSSSSGGGRPPNRSSRHHSGHNHRMVPAPIPSPRKSQSRQHVYGLPSRDHRNFDADVSDDDSDITSVSRMQENIAVNEQMGLGREAYEDLDFCTTINGRSFFHGKISRAIAEVKLSVAGDFLLRTPNGGGGADTPRICLSVLDDFLEAHHLLLSQAEVAIVRNNYELKRPFTMKTIGAQILHRPIFSDGGENDVLCDAVDGALSLK